MQGVHVQSLVGELRSYMPHGQKLKTWNKSNVATNSIATLKKVHIIKKILKKKISGDILHLLLVDCCGALFPFLLHISHLAQRRQSCHKLTLRILNSEPYVTLLCAAKYVSWAPRTLCTGVDPTFKSCGVKVQKIRHCLSQVALVVRNPPTNTEDIRKAGLILVGKIPWRRTWQPTPVCLPGESHGQRSLLSYSPWDHKESDTSEAT